MYLQLNSDFLEKLKKINNYSYSDILFRIYIFNHEQDILPENSALFAAISEHAQEEVEQALKTFKEEGIFTVISQDEYFDLQLEDFSRGRYECPNSRKRSTPVKKLTTKSLIEEQPEDLQDDLRQFVDMRAMTKAITPTGLKKALAHLDTLAKEYMEEHPYADDLEVRKKIVEQSTEHMWLGFYQLKENITGGTWDNPVPF